MMMKIIRALAIAILVASIAALALADDSIEPDLDQASRQASEETQQMLKNPEARAKAMKDNPSAQGVLDQLKGMGLTAEDQQALFELSSEIFGDMVKGSGGESLQMMELMEKAKKDPESFGKSLKPAQREKLRKIAGKLEKPPAKPNP